MANNNAINYNSASSLPASQGGTGHASLTAHGVLVGEGTSAITSLAVGTTGQLLIGSTSADPAFGSSANSDFTFTTATAGATRTLTVSNTDNTSASSTTTLAISNTNAIAIPTIDFVVSGVNTWELTGTASSLLIQRTSNNQVNFSHDGIRTYGSQPSAVIRKTTNQTNATGNGTNATVTYNTSPLFNRGSFYSGSGNNLGGSSNNIGIFLVCFQGSTSSAAGFTSGVCSITSTKHVFNVNQCNVGTTRNASNNFTGTRGMAVLNLASGDNINTQVKFSGSTLTASIQGVTGANIITYFEGAKVA